MSGVRKDLMDLDIRGICVHSTVREATEAAVIRDV